MTKKIILLLIVYQYIIGCGNNSKIQIAIEYQLIYNKCFNSNKIIEFVNSTNKSGISNFEKKFYVPVAIKNKSNDTLSIEMTNAGIIRSMRTEYYIRQDSLAVYDSKEAHFRIYGSYSILPNSTECFILDNPFIPSDRVDINNIELAYPFKRGRKTSDTEFLITKLKVDGERILYDAPYETYIMTEKDYRKKIADLAKVRPNK